MPPYGWTCASFPARWPWFTGAKRRTSMRYVRLGSDLGRVEHPGRMEQPGWTTRWRLTVTERICTKHSGVNTRELRERGKRYAPIHWHRSALSRSDTDLRSPPGSAFIVFG